MSTRGFSEINDVVDLDRFPINAPGSKQWWHAINSIRAELRKQGCSVLKGFVKEEVLSCLERESAAVAPSAYYSVETVNAYNIDLDAELEPGHPGKITFERGNAFVARDQISEESLINQLYVSASFKQYLAACFEVDEVYELADPLAGLCVNVLKSGKEHPWHFDINEFTVSLLTKKAQEGGVFEFCPNIRSPVNENFDDVKSVLEQRDDRRVQRLDLSRGDLQLFLGRMALHRVTPVKGDEDRLTAIFAYTKEPGVIGAEARTRQLFGRILPEHCAAELNTVRSDSLMD
ncbi:MAG: arpA protein [Candidatus Thiodiazotropha sp. (ex Lucinoma borealis)]|nr:arpA protein [Candidatus Thiodiazotropha sp. (ex Lucinoma borealis)]MCU7868595.1 arpA protein [Candidatus Thiodiazotropha sp. (ex Lucinoma borealis)]